MASKNKNGADMNSKNMNGATKSNKKPLIIGCSVSFIIFLTAIIICYAGLRQYIRTHTYADIKILEMHRTISPLQEEPDMENFGGVYIARDVIELELDRTIKVHKVEHDGTVTLSLNGDYETIDGNTFDIYEDQPNVVRAGDKFTMHEGDMYILNQKDAGNYEYVLILTIDKVYYE